MVWWRKTEQITTEKQLKKIQTLFLRINYTVRRSTPTAALRALFDVPQLSLTIRNVAMRSAYRRNCTGQLERWNGDLSKLFKDKLTDLKDEPQDKIRTLPMEEQLYKIHLPTIEEEDQRRPQKWSDMVYRRSPD